MTVARISCWVAAVTGVMCATLICIRARGESAGPQRTASWVDKLDCPKMPTTVPALSNARCGFLVVLESRHRPNGWSIGLAVAIIPATSPTPRSDPVVFMSGGHGGAARPLAQDLSNGRWTRHIHRFLSCLVMTGHCDGVRMSESVGPYDDPASKQLSRSTIL